MNKYLLKHRSILHSGANVELGILKSDLTIEELYEQYKKAGKDVRDPYAFIKYTKDYLGVKVEVPNSAAYNKIINKSTCVQFEDIGS